MYDEALQILGAEAAGRELTVLAPIAGRTAFLVHTTEQRDVVLVEDLVEHQGPNRWWVCSVDMGQTPARWSACYAMSDAGIAAFQAGARAAVDWDGRTGAPAGWDRSTAPFGPDAIEMPAGGAPRPGPVDRELQRTDVGTVIVCSIMLARPVRISSIGPVMTHQVVLRRREDLAVLAWHPAVSLDDVHGLHASVLTSLQPTPTVPSASTVEA